MALFFGLGILYFYIIPNTASSMAETTSKEIEISFLTLILSSVELL